MRTMDEEEQASAVVIRRCIEEATTIANGKLLRVAGRLFATAARMSLRLGVSEMVLADTLFTLAREQELEAD